MSQQESVVQQLKIYIKYELSKEYGPQDTKLTMVKTRRNFWCLIDYMYTHKITSIKVINLVGNLIEYVICIMHISKQQKQL